MNFESVLFAIAFGLLAMISWPPAESGLATVADKTAPIENSPAVDISNLSIEDVSASVAIASETDVAAL